MPNTVKEADRVGAPHVQGNGNGSLRRNVLKEAVNEAVASKLPGMAQWRDKMFAFMSHNAATATDYFSLPPGRVIEIGSRVEF